MANEGYDRVDEKRVEVAFSDFELRRFRTHILPLFKEYSIDTVLDYGCGGSDWEAKNFDAETNNSAIEYFNLQNAYKYEPARDIDERQNVDCVVSFDVLEHIFISDVPTVLRDILSYANKLVILNIACYPAAAQLPNGENAHITLRNYNWWKGMLDGISVEFPETSICLICSSEYGKSDNCSIWNANSWQESETFVIE